MRGQLDGARALALAGMLATLGGLAAIQIASLARGEHETTALGLLAGSVASSLLGPVGGLSYAALVAVTLIGVAALKLLPLALLILALIYLASLLSGDRTEGE